jgi:hypothetical protein
MLVLAAHKGSNKTAIEQTLCHKKTLTLPSENTFSWQCPYGQKYYKSIQINTDLFDF